MSKSQFVLWSVLVFSLVGVARPTQAMNASPEAVRLKQPDGTEVKLFVRGCEHHHFFEDAQGYTVVCEKGSYVYAKRNLAGELKPTNLKVGAVNPTAVGLMKGLRASPEVVAALHRTVLAEPRQGVVAMAPGATPPPPQAIAPSGVVKNLVVLCQFSDHNSTHIRPPADYDVIMNAVGGNATLAPTGSVKDYYNEVSYGAVDLQSTVVAWVTLPQTEAYYANGSSGLGGSYPANPQGMVEDALNLVDGLVDFGQFDMDNDGFVDAIDIIHSGYAAETGGGGGNWIWSHKWSLWALPGGRWTSADNNGNGVKVKVYDYHTEAALWGTSGTGPTRIGVICHEAGHFFGLPDLYDTNDGGEGIGSYCLMANSWGFDSTQQHPPHFSAWCKTQLGWVTPTVISPGLGYSLPRVAVTPTVYKITQGYPSGEYLLIENRQPFGFENNMPQGGLAIWHVDENKTNNTAEGYPGQSGWPANNNHYKVALLQADGQYHLEKGVNRGDAGDVYHGGGVAAITRSSVPNTQRYQGGVVQDSGNVITNISVAGNTMTFDYVEDATPVITSPLLIVGEIGVSLNYQITATASPTSFGAAGLPPGLSINTSTGVISGIPVMNGRSDVTLSATNAQVTGTADLVIRVGQVDYFTELFDGVENAYDLTNKSFTFTPDTSASRYSVMPQTRTSFPTDPTGGTTLPLGDDSFSAVTLSGGATVHLYGQSYDQVFVGSNGYISFGSGTGSIPSSVADHFARPQVTGLGLDLDPSAQGTVSYRQLADRLAVTWQNVTEYGVTNSNNFQIELYFDGRITITHLTVAAQASIIGLSEGGGEPADFFMSDFSAYASETLAVTLPAASIETAGLLEGQGLLTVTTAPAANLTVTLSSSDSSEVTVPATVVIPAGMTSVFFDLTVIDDELLDGTRTVSVTANASGYRSGADTIAITDNETTSISVALPDSASEGGPTVTGTVTLGAASGSDVAIALSSGDATEATVPASVTVLAGQTTANFVITPVDDNLIDGTQSVSISADVVGWTGGSDTMEILDNEVKELSLAQVGILSEGGSGLMTVSASGIVTSDLEVTLVSVNPARLLLPSTVTIPTGESTVSFTAMAVDNALSEGTQTATATASAVDFVDGEVLVSIFDDEVHHFTMGAVDDPTKAGQLFALNIQARDVNGVIVPSFTGSLTLSAVGDAGGIVLSASSTGPFSAGQSQAMISVNTLSTNVVITADTGSGATVSSNPFSVVPGDVHHCEWAAIPPPQTKDIPFLATITAKDSLGNTAVGFEETVSLTAQSQNTVTSNLWINQQGAVYTQTDEYPFTVGYEFTPAVDITVQSVRSYFGSKASIWSGDGQLIATTTLNGAPGQWTVTPFPSPVVLSAGVLYRFGVLSPGTPYQFSDVVPEKSALMTSLNSSYAEGDAMPNFPSAPENSTAFNVDLVFTGPEIVPLSPEETPNFVEGVGAVDLEVHTTGTQLTISALAMNGATGQSNSFDVQATGGLTVTVPATVSEGAVPVLGTVAISTPAAADLPVTVTTNDSSELVVPDTVIILQGQTSATFALAPVDDFVVDGDQVVTVTADANSLSVGNGNITVLDDEERVITLTPGGTELREGNGAMSVEISLSSPSTQTVHVTLTSSDETELTAPTEVVFLPGESLAYVDVEIVDDTAFDGTQSITLSAAAPGWLNTPSAFTVADNDVHHFAFTPIPSPQQVGEPFYVEFYATDVNGEWIDSYEGPITFSAAGTSGVVSLTPTSGYLYSGYGYEEVTITTMTTNVVITATDGVVSGMSNAFDVVAGPPHHFEWSTQADRMTVDPVPVTVTARDQSGNVATGFDGVATLSGFYIGATTSGIVISEINPNTPDEIEFQNVGTTSVDVSGWLISIYDNASYPAPLTTFVVPAGSVCGAGQIFRLQEFGTSPGTYPILRTGANIDWTSASGSRNAVLLRKPDGSIVDFVCTTSASAGGITSPVTIPGTQWSGSSLAAPTNATYGYLRIGNSDQHSAIDWTTGAPSIGTTNAGLTTPFFGSEHAVNIAPNVSANFVEGVWNGAMSVYESAVAMRFRASTGVAEGVSNPFNVTSRGTVSIALPTELTEGGASGEGTVSVSAAAPTDLTVNLATSPAAQLDIPPTVTILSGQTSVSFAISATNDANLDGHVGVSVTASSLGYDSGSASVLVRDDEVGTITVTLPASATEGAGTLTNQGTVSISPVPTFNVTVTLTSSDTTELTVPSFVVVPAGASSATFSPTVVNDTVIDGSKSVIVSAVVTGWNNGSASMDILDNESRQLSISFSPSSGNEASAVVGTISVPANVESAMVVTLTPSSAADFALASTNWTIPGNASAVVFSVGTNNDVVYEGDEVITFTASSATLTTGTSNYTILENDPHNFVFTTIANPQYQGGNITPTITARYQNNSTMTGFTGTATLSAASGASPVALSTANTGSFVSGVWTGSFAVNDLASNVVVTASSPSGLGASNAFDVIFPVTSFAISAISSPRAMGSNFTVTITARKSDGTTATSFSSVANLAASVGGANISLTPTQTTAFTNGVWTGPVAIWQAAQGAKLTATLGAASGQSNTFNVTGKASRLEFSTIPAVKSGNSIPLTITAKDSYGVTDAAYAFSLQLTTLSPGRDEIMVGAGATSSSSWLNATSAHDERSQNIYTASDLGGRPARLTGIALNATSASTTTFSNFTIRVKHTALTSFAVPQWESGWSTVFTGDVVFTASGWRTFNFSTPFDYDGTSSLMVDISFDNASTFTAASLRAEPTESLQSNFGISLSANGTPTTWTGVTPTISGVYARPQIRLFREGGITVSSQIVGPLTAGVWTGNVTLTGPPAAEVRLAATDSTGRTGLSNVFPLDLPTITLGVEPTFTGGATNDVTWTPQTVVPSYELQVGLNSGFTSLFGNLTPVVASATVAGLSHNTSYYYRVRSAAPALHGNDARVLTTSGDFLESVLTNASSDVYINAVTLAETNRTSSTQTENFDSLGGGWTPLFTANVGNSGYTLTSSSLGVGPNTTPPLPINQGGDFEGMLTGTSVYSAALDNIDNAFSDGYIETYLCAATPAAGNSAGVNLRAGTTNTGRPTGYSAYLSYTSATSAVLFISFTHWSTLTNSSAISVSTDEIIRLRFSARGPRLIANAWKVAVVGGVVTETPLVLSGTSTDLVTHDTKYSRGRAGIRGSGTILFDDLVIARDVPTYASSGSAVLPTISSSVRNQWGTVSYNAETNAGVTSLTVDALDATSGSVLASNLASGTNLNSLPSVAAATGLRFRVNLSTNNTIYTPALRELIVSYTGQPSISAPWSNVVSSTQDSLGPVLAVTSATATTLAAHTITGTAADSPAGVANVTVNGVLTGGTTNWSRNVTLSPGMNSFTIQGSDNAMPAQTSTLVHQVFYASAAADSDNDGMDDLYEYTHGLDPFDGGTSSPAHGPLGDLDRDGTVNLLEYAFGLSPGGADTAPLRLNGAQLLARGMPTVISGAPRRFVFLRRLDHAAQGLIYSVQFSANLTNWETVGTAPTVLASDAEVEACAVDYPATLTGGATPKFARVVVTSP